VTFDLHIARNANNYLERLDAKTQQRFANLFEQLSEFPLDHSKPLRGSGGRRSARVGSWRVIFEIDHVNKLVVVSDIGPRGQIYRELGR